MRKSSTRSPFALKYGAVGVPRLWGTKLLSAGLVWQAPAVELKQSPLSSEAGTSAEQTLSSNVYEEPSFCGETTCGR